MFISGVIDEMSSSANIDMVLIAAALGLLPRVLTQSLGVLIRCYCERVHRGPLRDVLAARDVSLEKGLLALSPNAILDSVSVADHAMKSLTTFQKYLIPVEIS